MFSLQARSPDDWQHESTVEEGVFLLQTKENQRKKSTYLLGCIVGANPVVLHLVIAKTVENNIPRLNRYNWILCLGTKGAKKSKFFYSLSKEDVVH